MKRREFLALGLAIPVAPVLADCRDGRGLIGADWDDDQCHRLYVRNDINDRFSVARASFGMGHYEKLHEIAGEWFRFEFGEMRHMIRVTRISIDVDRFVGCVLVDVDGAYKALG